MILNDGMTMTFTHINHDVTKRQLYRDLQRVSIKIYSVKINAAASVTPPYIKYLFNIESVSSSQSKTLYNIFDSFLAFYAVFLSFCGIAAAHLLTTNMTIVTVTLVKRNNISNYIEKTPFRQYGSVPIRYADKCLYNSDDIVSVTICY